MALWPWGVLAMMALAFAGAFGLAAVLHRRPARATRPSQHGARPGLRREDVRHRRPPVRRARPGRRHHHVQPQVQKLFADVLDAATEQAIMATNRAGTMVLFNAGAERRCGTTSAR